MQTVKRPYNLVIELEVHAATTRRVGFVNRGDALGIRGLLALAAAARQGKKGRVSELAHA